MTCLPILVVFGDQCINALVESFYSSTPYTGFLVWWSYHCVTTIICIPLLNTGICLEANRNFLEFRKVNIDKVVESKISIITKTNYSVVFAYVYMYM